LRLDVLLDREGLTFNEACGFLRTNEKGTLSHQELADLADRLPHRDPPRRMLGAEELEGRPAEAETPEESLLGQEVARRELVDSAADWSRRMSTDAAGKSRKASGRSRPWFPFLPRTRLIVYMRSGFHVSRIAKALRRFF